MALEILSSIGGKIAELLVEPIGRRLMFIILPSKNIPKLKSKAEELEALRKGVQETIDSATRNGQVIRSDVKQWTEKVDKLIEETKLIAPGGSHENSKCLGSRFILNPATRYHKGKRAEEKTKELDELLATGRNFNNTNIANPAPPLGIEALPSTGSAYAATRLAREQVMKALRDENINFIAIHGIGGVGKTTLVTDIGKKVKEDKLFDEVVFGVVSQNLDIKKIQGEIAGMLGLSLTDEPVMTRATRLCERIKKVGRILVIFDDVWNKLELQTVGIPSDVDHQGCKIKIIITTRRKQVCNAMGPVGRRETVALNVLSDEDSWDLFSSRAGREKVNFPKLNAIAKEVWRECGHLPLALVTVGSAMSGKEDPDEWKEAARQLKDAAPHDIEDVEEHVYKSIKLSFDYLKDETAKNVVLLCTLFPEDHNIRIEDMVRYGWGLRMFRGGSIDTVHEARRRMKTLINNLKEASLLLPSDYYGLEGMFVKMHDVVRDVAIRIGLGKYISVAGSRSLENWPSMMRETMDNYEGISLMGDEIDNYPTVWDFPKLKILLLLGRRIGSLSCEHYLSKLKELNVLHVSPNVGKYFYVDRVVLGAGHYAVSHLQTCLRTLILRRIDGPDIAAIGKITALEILDLKGCRFHDEPNASWIRALTNLRVLDLEDTEFPNLVADTRFLSPDLTCLEELYMGGRRLCWDDMKIARNLPRLKVLKACTRDIETMPPDFVFPHQLETFFITFGCDTTEADSDSWKNRTPTLILHHILEESAYVWRGSLTTLLTKCRSLTISSCRKMESIFPDLSARAEDLKLLTDLVISDCDEFRSIINTTTTTAADAGHQQLLLSSLEYLSLSDLPRLEYIFKHSSSVSLCNLKHVIVGMCDILEKYLFPPAVAQSLVQLEELRVFSCPQLGEIVGDDQDGDQEKTNDNNIVRRLEFPNLKLVSLDNLPELRGFCCSRGDLLFDWPSLKRLRVTGCPKMTTFARTSSSAASLKCRSLTILSCRKMESIFPDLSARADDLKLLTHLEIIDCDEFRSIINTTTTAADASHQQLLLSSLESLTLSGLPRLEYIFKHSSSVSLRNLKKVSVGLCDILKKYLFQPAVAQSLVQLEELEVYNCPQLGEIVGDDLDGDQGEEEKTNDNNIVRRLEFPNLKQVILYNLPELRGFCCSRGDLLFDWPSLERLEVDRCPKMTTFARTSSSAGTLGTPKLKSVEIGDTYSSKKKEMIPQGMDLNQFLQKAHGGGGAEEMYKTSDT